MKESEKIALIDLDGTLADYDLAMTEALQKTLSPGEVLPEDLYGDEGKENWLRERMRLIKRQPGFWMNLPAISEGMLVYDLLGHLGYTRMVLTKGPRSTVEAWTEKVIWCSRHVPSAGITVITHGDSEKQSHKGLVYGKVLFDDYPPYVEQWLEWRPRGKVLMLDTKYNQGFSHPQVLRIPRYARNEKLAQNLSEFYAVQGHEGVRDFLKETP